jgi:hypothetical protein
VNAKTVPPDKDNKIRLSDWSPFVLQQKMLNTSQVVSSAFALPLLRRKSGFAVWGIEFAAGADVTPGFEKAVLTEVDQKDWKRLCL